MKHAVEDRTRMKPNPVAVNSASLRYAKGLSLIELMVALALGAFLMMAAVTVFLGNKNSSELETTLARLQENGRFAVDLITSDLHSAQYLGCNTGDVFLANMVAPPTSPAFANTQIGVIAYELQTSGDWATYPALPATMTGGTDPIETSARVGSDVLSIRTGEVMEGAELTGKVLPGESEVSISGNPNCAIETGSRVALASCSIMAHMFMVTNAISCTPATSGNTVTLEAGSASNSTTTFNTVYGDDDFSDANGDGVEILVLKEVYWFVADTGRTRNGQPVYALYREIDGDRQEMIEGVENMQIKFGQRLALSDNLRYVDPSDATLNAAGNYVGVNTVRIALLVQSFDRVQSTDDDRTYRLLDVEIESGADAFDHNGGPVLREVFSATVELRNAPEVTDA